MPLFSYVATNETGEEVAGSVEAHDLALAINQVRSMGYFPTRMHEDAGRFARRKHAKATGTTLALGVRIKRKQITLLTRQLGTLINAGLPLLRSLDILHHQQKQGKLRDILNAVMNDVRSGMSLSDALAKHPKAFSKLYVNMVRAGEVGGMLEVVLNRLADFGERREALGRKVKSAMAYPITVLIVTGCVVSFLLLRVVPVFQEIFFEFGILLPAPTRFLLRLSETLRHSFPGILLYSTAAAVGLKLLLRLRPLQAIKDTLALKVPVVGKLITKIAVARFARTLGTLITSGVPILQSLTIVRETISNRVIANAVGKVHDSVREGETIAEPLEKSNAFPYMAVNMIDVGEETGSLDSMLLKIADIYDAEVEAALGGALQMLEPVMVVLLGSIVGFIVAAMYLPIIDIVTKGI